jgi:hypothetical protein
VVDEYAAFMITGSDQPCEDQRYSKASENAGTIRKHGFSRSETLLYSDLECGKARLVWMF